jgi:hypothetical protein
VLPLKCTFSCKKLVYSCFMAQIYNNIIRWWLLCALDENCIAPTYNTACWFDKQFTGRYADCHRYDQSALNILLANYFDDDEQRYTGKHRVLVVKRMVENLGLLHICRPRRQLCGPPVNYFNDTIRSQCFHPSKLRGMYYHEQ